MRHGSKVAAVKSKLEKNGYKCALTGWDISPKCFELDHIVAMNDGGTDDPSNLQCVHPLVNRAKGTMGNQQFIDMCKAVAIQNADTDRGVRLSESFPAILKPKR